MFSKKELRSIFKEKRTELNPSIIHRMNDLILINFQTIALPDLECVHTFLSSQTHLEVDTAPIIRYLDFRFPELIVAAPRISANNQMQHISIDEDSEYQLSKFGIEEPINGDSYIPSAFDLILVPLLAFDLNGNRVGYGKGYYDYFLKVCRPDAIKIGLSFFDPVEEISDISPYDIPLDFCVTPTQVFNFSEL